MTMGLGGLELEDDDDGIIGLRGPESDWVFDTSTEHPSALFASRDGLAFFFFF